MCSHIWTRRHLNAHTDLDIWTINVLPKMWFLSHRSTQSWRLADKHTQTFSHFQANREKADRHVLSQEGSSLVNPKIFGLSEPEGLGEEWPQGVYLLIATTFVKASNWRVPRKGSSNVPEGSPLEQPSSRYSWWQGPSLILNLLSICVCVRGGGRASPFILSLGEDIDKAVTNH